MFFRGEFDREDEDPEYKPTRTPFKDEIDEFANSPPEDKEESIEIHPSKIIPKKF